MSDDHVGIPRFIENGFAVSGMVFSYDTSLNRIRHSPINKLGTEKDYYDPDVEKELLANNIESNFSKLYNSITNTTDIDVIGKAINSNKCLIVLFFSFMFFRSKKSLEEANKSSLSSALFGNLDHSELLRIQSIIQVDPLKLIGNQYEIAPIINTSKVHFINNSIGIGVMMTKTKKSMFFFPLNPSLGLVFSDKSFRQEANVFYTDANNDAITKRLNESLVIYELGYGNGFLFGQCRHDLKDSIELYRNLKHLKK